MGPAVVGAVALLLALLWVAAAVARRLVMPWVRLAKAEA
jgi:hypothetical protein